MWGPEGVTRAVRRNLLAALPAQTDALRAKYGVGPAELPGVKAVYSVPREFAEIGEYPVVMLSAMETEGQLDTRQIEAGPDYDEFSLLYRVRALVFCMGNDYEATELLTQRTILAVRQSLLVNKRYGDPEGGDGAVLDSRRLRESYAETTASSGGHLGGGWVEIGVRSTERLYTGIETTPVATLASAVHPAMVDEP